MWIRSQNKKVLINTNEIWISDDNCSDSKTNIVAVNSTLNIKGGFFLGDYKSEERAIEVLDDIQDQLTKCNERIVNFNYDYANYSNTTYSEKSNIVYQMPQE